MNSPSRRLSSLSRVRILWCGRFYIRSRIRPQVVVHFARRAISTSIIFVSLSFSLLTHLSFSTIGTYDNNFFPHFVYIFDVKGCVSKSIAETPSHTFAYWKKNRMNTRQTCQLNKCILSRRQLARSKEKELVKMNIF